MSQNKNTISSALVLKATELCAAYLFKCKLVCVKSPYNSSPFWVSHKEFITTKKTAQLEKLVEFKIKKINHEILQIPKNKN